ncbi:DUF1800 domain-containing protein [Altericista sp. CCNU0014]|uniref:DUF1800 domain-containing protein n=1 Tax=Altericista sp. CCNU0014 TaxID=3082949 RepID=UPI00384BD08B
MNAKKNISIQSFYILALTVGFGFLSPSRAAVPPDPKVLHALDRLSFGPQPGDIERAANLGIERYIQQQLNPNAIPESQRLNARLAQLETLELNSLQLLEQIELPRSVKGQKPTPEQRRAYQQEMRYVREQAEQARLLRATESPRQLQEVMVDFWYNHFNVFDRKGVTRFLVGAYEREAIRPHTFGRFRDLVGATARHPAMLFYLDNWQNTVATGPNARGKARGLNENYARELMELHTLGVDGGYTQQDVVALAKILTGWTFRRSARPGVGEYGFYFDAQRHDYSDKVFMGRTIQGSGMAEGEQALDMLARSPVTARRISYKLAQYFVADRPPNPLVDRLSQTFLSTDGNIQAVLSALFRSPEFWDSRYYKAKFKTPYQYALSAVRATGTEVTNFRPVVGFLQQAGMPLYGCLTPDGYKNTEAAWLNPDAMTRRISFATALASGRLPLTTAMSAASSERPPSNRRERLTLAGPMLRKSLKPSSALMAPLDATQLGLTLGNPFSAKTQQAIAASPPQLRAALVLGSPEFMRR